MLFNRISIDPKICHGQACIKGTRIPAHQIVGMLAGSDTFDSLLRAYPHITREDIRACLEYAAWLAEESVRLRKSPLVYENLRGRAISRSLRLSS